MRNILKKHAEKLRFILVGSLNTIIDFGILFALVSFGFNEIASNYVSATIALIFSFYANKSYTFRVAGTNKRQFILFLVVTLVGPWIIQPLSIAGIAHFADYFNLEGSSVLFVGKILGTVGTLIWNYILYSRVVFKKPVSQDL